MEQASIILQPFQFGEQFLELNREPLVDYANATSRKHIEELQYDYFLQGL